MRYGKMLMMLGLVAMLGSAAARASLIGYEPFDYPETNLLTGLDGSGWPGGEWMVAGGSGSQTNQYEIRTPGLTYANGATLYTKGNYCYTTNGENWHTCTRDLAGNPAGDPGTTNWLSILVALNSSTNTPASGLQQLIFSLQGTGGGNPVRFIGANASISNQWVLNQGGGSNFFSGHYMTQGEIIFAVIELAYGAEQDDYALWINPSVNVAPNYDDATRGQYAHGALTGVQFNRGSRSNMMVAAFDEVRVGTAWNDVNTDEPVLVNTPDNIAPSNTETGVVLTPVLQASAFSSADTLDTHAQSVFNVESLDGVVVLNVTTGALTSITLPAGMLQADTRYYWNVQYKGSHSAKWSLPSAATWFDTTYVTPQSPQVYDGAAYAPTTNGIGGYTGGSGAWRDGWTELEGYNYFFSKVDVATPGLEYRDLVITGNTFVTTAQIDLSQLEGTNSQSRARRSLQRDGYAHLLDPAGMYATSGMTVWLSTVIRAPQDMLEAEGYGVELCNANDAREASRYQFGKPSDAAFWGMRGYGRASRLSTQPVMTGDTVCLVARIAYLEDTNTTVQLWVNPQVGVEPPTNEIAATDTITTNISVYSFDRIGIFATRASTDTLTPVVQIDEVRLGDSWDAVLPSNGNIVPSKPSNVTPASGALDVALAGTLAGSAFSAPSGTMVASEARVTSGGGVLHTFAGATESIAYAGLQPDTRYTWQIRYKSSASDVWSAWSDATIFETILYPARLLAYDGALYPPTNTANGANGGFGWSNAWAAQTLSGTNLTTLIGVDPSGLAYDLLHVTGGTFCVDNAFTNTARLTRLLTTGDGYAHLTYADKKFGRPGSTNWISFLTACGDDYTNGSYGVGLYEGSTLRLGLGKGVTTKRWTLSGRSSAMASDYTNALTFMVMRVANAQNVLDGSVYVWTNALLEETPPLDSDAIITEAALTNIYFNSIGLFAAGRTYTDGVTTNYGPTPGASLDEVRFAESWQELIAVPEPALALLALALATAIARRAR